MIKKRIFSHKLSIFNHCQTLSIILLLSLSVYKQTIARKLFFFFFIYFPIHFHFSIISSTIDCRRFFLLKLIFFFLIMFWKLSLNFHLIKSFCLNKVLFNRFFLLFVCAYIFQFGRLYIRCFIFIFYGNTQKKTR